jgi:ribose 5-phosphate isomerase A
MNDNLIEQGKKNAALKAVDENIKEELVIGIGSGSTIVYAVNRMGQLNREKNLNLICVASSFQARQLILENNLQIASLDEYPEVDIDFDGADEIDQNLNLIKGGGGCLVQEKILASNSRKLIIIADYRKNSENLGQQWKKGVPVEVIPMAYFPLLRKFSKMGGKPILRMAQAKAGPLITDNNNFIIDVDFGIIKNPQELNAKILTLPGVVDTGLFLNMTYKAYIGQQNGQVLVLNKN